MSRTPAFEAPQFKRELGLWEHLTWFSIFKDLRTRPTSR